MLAAVNYLFDAVFRQMVSIGNYFLTDAVPIEQDDLVISAGILFFCTVGFPQPALIESFPGT